MERNAHTLACDKPRRQQPEGKPRCSSPAYLGTNGQFSTPLNTGVVGETHMFNAMVGASDGKGVQVRNKERLVSGMGLTQGHGW